MFFTKEDYQKIEKYLLENSIKDTEFSKAAPLSGREVVAIVQNGHNVKVTLNTLRDALFSIGVDDFLNISTKYNETSISLLQAITLIPLENRKPGQVITFFDDTHKWVVYQFTGEVTNQWNNLTLWVDVLNGGTGINVVPDNEDTVGVPEGNLTLLKFANKEYDPVNFSGLARTFLRKNITTNSSGTTINLLTQEMVNTPHTIYHIQYDYDLNGSTINIPEGCILQFDGGSLTNGTIKGNNTKLSGTINITCSGSGSFDLNRANVKDFGAVGDLVTDDTEAFERALSFLTTPGTSNVAGANTLYLPSGSYSLYNIDCKDANIVGESALNTVISGRGADAVFTLTSPNTSMDKVKEVSGLYFINGILAVKGDNFDIKNCIFTAQGTNYIDVKGNNVNIYNNLFNNKTAAIKIADSLVDIYNNKFSAANPLGPNYALIDIQNTSNSSEISIRNNWFYSYRVDAVSVSGLPPQTLMIQGNIFTIYYQSTGMKISLGSYTNNGSFYIQGNRFISTNVRDKETRGIVVEATGGASNNIEISENSFSNIATPVYVDTDAYNTTIKSNHIKGAYGPSVYSPSRYTTIIDNVLEGTPVALFQPAAVFISAGIAPIIKGNVFRITGSPLPDALIYTTQAYKAIITNNPVTSVNTLTSVIPAVISEAGQANDAFIEQPVTIPNSGTSNALPEGNNIPDGFRFYQTDKGKYTTYSKSFGWIED